MGSWIGVTEDERVLWYNPIGLILWIYSFVYSHIYNMFAGDICYRAVWRDITRGFWDDLAGWPLKRKKRDHNKFTSDN